ncbi:MAG TPA: hypothetical protein VGK78_16640 [Nocardioides sp.]|uniref:hypothetical protein n=1 Tax=Nocardioides sp. TaxID=35761 RepID=UPI002F4038ED
MGVDRKGPLAAFVVIAVIAAVLLVTSVRSQAAPGWLNPDNLPASVVAGPATTDPLWGPVTAHVDQVVEQGVVLVQKVTSDPSEIQDPTVTLADPAGGSDEGSPARTDDSQTTVHHAGHVRHDATAPSPATHDSGRHVGSGHGHGQTVWRAVGHGHGHAQSNGHRSHGRHLGWSRHS